MTLDELAGRASAWMSGDGPEAGIVASSRVRLARNLADQPFPHRADDRRRRSAFEKVSEAGLAVGSPLADPTLWNLEELPPSDRRLLLERHLASARLLRGEGPRGVLVTPGETLALQVNEEDHVRIQSVVAGFELETALAGAVALDRALETRLDWACSPERGYLTACPTNVGTGLRASVRIHLPALALAGEVKKVQRAVHEMGMVVRGWFGEGSVAVGETHELSNQRTLGRTEEETVAELGRVVRRVLELETEARARLGGSPARLRRIEDRVHRSWGTLRHARMLTVDQTMACVSDLRLGAWMDLIDDVPGELLHRVGVLSQPAHLARRLGRELDEDEERWERAAWVRAVLAGAGPLG